MTAAAAAVVVDEAARARLAPGVVLRQDKARGHWTLQGPERVLVLDDNALAVVRAAAQLPGASPGRTLAEAIDALAAEFDAPRAELAGDVLELVADMRDRGFVVVG
jgi:pyrroloquinoline quinone biosynthesis protein D